MAQHREADEPGDQYAMGLYLLGSLAVEERAAFESHVTRCGSCLADSVRLSPVVTAMSMLTDEDVRLVLAAADQAVQDAESATAPAHLTSGRAGGSTTRPPPRRPVGQLWSSPPHSTARRGPVNDRAASSPSAASAEA